MKIILSPAKKMVSDTDSLAPVNVPKHMDQTAAILSFMKSQSEEELKAVWKCNDCRTELLQTGNYGSVPWTYSGSIIL